MVPQERLNCRLVCGGRSVLSLQDAATTAATNLPLLPGLPSNALTDALGYLHAHPQLRSALVAFLKADSTKEFLATVTQLAIKVNPKDFAALVSRLSLSVSGVSDTRKDKVTHDAGSKHL